MPDPTAANADVGLYGVKFATLIAGFAGGVVSLSFVKELKPVQAALAVFTGAVSAGYGTPLVLQYFNLTQAGENGIAFLVGLTAMNLIPGIIKLSERFKSDPLATIRGGEK